MRITTDYTPHSTVVACACGWREVGTTRGVALRAAAVHLEAVHPDGTGKRAAKFRENAKRTDATTRRRLHG